MQLSKEDEVSAGEENEVRREDQEKINRFSRLHQRELVLEEVLKGKKVGIFLHSLAALFVRLGFTGWQRERVSYISSCMINYGRE